jgi:hypothetical protein
VPPVHEDGERHRGRPAKVHQGVHRCADRPAGEQDVVDQHDRLAGDVETDPGLVHLGGLGPHADVIPVEGDVEDPHGDLRPFDPGDLGGKAASQVVATGGDPHQSQPVGSLVPFQDLMGDPGDRPPDLTRVQQANGGHHEGAPGRRRGRAHTWSSIRVPPFPASRDRT